MSGCMGIFGTDLSVSASKLLRHSRRIVLRGVGRVADDLHQPSRGVEVGHAGHQVRELAQLVGCLAQLLQGVDRIHREVAAQVVEHLRMIR